MGILCFRSVCSDHSACSSSSVLNRINSRAQVVGGDGVAGNFRLGVEAIVGLFSGMAVLRYGSFLLCTVVLQYVYIYIYIL